jgi:hypothetical protein
MNNHAGTVRLPGSKASSKMDTYHLSVFSKALFSSSGFQSSGGYASTYRIFILTALLTIFSGSQPTHKIS